MKGGKVAYFENGKRSIVITRALVTRMWSGASAGAAFLFLENKTAPKVPNFWLSQIAKRYKSV